MAALGGNLQVLEKLWKCANENITREEINKLLLATDNMGKTAWHAAAENGGLDVLQKIWEWAKENLTCEEMNNKLLLATDNTGKTA
jgi:endo-1,4-beta-D-glucanase Y